MYLMYHSLDANLSAFARDIDFFEYFRSFYIHLSSADSLDILGILDTRRDCSFLHGLEGFSYSQSSCDHERYWIAYWIAYLLTLWYACSAKRWTNFRKALWGKRYICIYVYIFKTHAHTNAIGNVLYIYVQKLQKAAFLARPRFQNVLIVFAHFCTSPRGRERKRVIRFIDFITCRAERLLFSYSYAHFEIY